LAIGLPVARATLDERLRRLRLAALWGSWQPAADWQSACRDPPVISQVDASPLCGQVVNLRPIVNRPACSAYSGEECVRRLRLAALWGRQSCLQPPF